MANLAMHTVRAPKPRQSHSDQNKLITSQCMTVSGPTLEEVEFPERVERTFGISKRPNVASGALERLARQYYRRQSEAFDARRFEGNMIPELSTDIFAQESRDGELLYGFSNLVAGIVEPSGHGRSEFIYRRATVAVLHAHWIDTRCSSSRGFGRSGIDTGRFSDERAARQIRRDIGTNVRLYVYQWGGRWGYC